MYCFLDEVVVVICVFPSRRNSTSWRLFFFFRETESTAAVVTSSKRHSEHYIRFFGKYVHSIGIKHAVLFLSQVGTSHDWQEQEMK